MYQSCVIDCIFHKSVFSSDFTNVDAGVNVTLITGGNRIRLPVDKSRLTFSSSFIASNRPNVGSATASRLLRFWVITLQNISTAVFVSDVLIPIFSERDDINCLLFITW